MTSKADARCFLKFDWLGKNVEPIKFHVTLMTFDIYDKTLLTLMSG